MCSYHTCILLLITLNTDSYFKSSIISPFRTPSMLFSSSFSETLLRLCCFHVLFVLSMLLSFLILLFLVHLIFYLFFLIYLLPFVINFLRCLNAGTNSSSQYLIIKFQFSSVSLLLTIGTLRLLTWIYIHLLSISSPHIFRIFCISFSMNFPFFCAFYR